MGPCQAASSPSDLRHRLWIQPCRTRVLCAHKVLFTCTKKTHRRGVPCLPRVLDETESGRTRLRKSKMKKEHKKSTQEVAAAAAATCWQGSDCKNNAHKVMIIQITIQKNILKHKFRIRMKRQVLSCSSPAATRASSRATTKKRA